jgi:hypothetical protein
MSPLCGRVREYVNRNNTRQLQGLPVPGHARFHEGFVKLLRRRRSSGKRVLLPGPTRPLGSPLHTRNFSPALESLPHLLAVLRCGQ